MNKIFKFQNKAAMASAMGALHLAGVVGAWTDKGETSCRYFDAAAKVWRDFIVFDAHRFGVAA